MPQTSTSVIIKLVKSNLCAGKISPVRSLWRNAVMTCLEFLKCISKKNAVKTVFEDKAIAERELRTRTKLVMVVCW